MSSSLDTVDDGRHAAQPLNREQFADLRRGDTIQERRGRRRVWIVTCAASQQDRDCVVVLRSGDLVRIERDRFADDYSLIESPELRMPVLAR
jgi:hypothetical protein